MTVLALVWNLAVVALVVTTIVVTIRRPAERWRAGRWGKAASVAGSLLVAFYVGPLSIPLGAAVVLVRHRRQRSTDEVGMAEDWPGA